MALQTGEADEWVIRRGVHEPFYWLTCTVEAYMGTVLRLCPELVLNRYLAVTSQDSGVRRLIAEERDAGWTTKGDIAYSPLIESVDGLQYQRDGLDGPGYDEWYVLESRRELAAEVFRGPWFDFEPSSAELFVFVNHFGFALHGSEQIDFEILALFWKQMARIQPESYIADGSDCVSIVSKHMLLIDAIEIGLREASCGTEPATKN